MKKVIQVLASIVFTPILTGVSYGLMTLYIMLLSWLVAHLSTFWFIILLITIGLAPIMALFSGIGGLLFVFPLRWILNNNIAAKYITIIMSLVLIIYNIVMLWLAPHATDWKTIIILLSACFMYCVTPCTTIYAAMNMNNE